MVAYFYFMDGNKKIDPRKAILHHLDTRQYAYFGSIAMPRHQLQRAIPFTKIIREKHPHSTSKRGNICDPAPPIPILQSGDMAIRAKKYPAFAHIYATRNREGRAHHESKH
jgi:hypothetical protein